MEGLKILNTYNKRDKAHGRIISKASYVEDLVAIHFGLSGDPKFHHPKFPGIISVGLASDKVYIYVKDSETEYLVFHDLQTYFEPDETKWITIKIIGEVIPAN